MQSSLAVALGDPAGIGPEIVAKAWDYGRGGTLAPFFAVGDARSGSVKRMSAAVGEGASVVKMVHDHLATGGCRF